MDAEQKPLLKFHSRVYNSIANGLSSRFKLLHKATLLSHALRENINAWVTSFELFARRPVTFDARTAIKVMIRRLFDEGVDSTDPAHPHKRESSLCKEQAGDLEEYVYHRRMGRFVRVIRKQKTEESDVEYNKLKAEHEAPHIAAVARGARLYHGAAEVERQAIDLLIKRGRDFMGLVLRRDGVPEGLDEEVHFAGNDVRAMWLTAADGTRTENSQIGPLRNF